MPTKLVIDENKNVHMFIRVNLLIYALRENIIETHTYSETNWNTQNSMEIKILWLFTMQFQWLPNWFFGINLNHTPNLLRQIFVVERAMNEKHLFNVGLKRVHETELINETAKEWEMVPEMNED